MNQKPVNFRLSIEADSDARSDVLEDYLLFQHQLRQLQVLANAAGLELAKSEATEPGNHGSAASSHYAATVQPGSIANSAELMPVATAAMPVICTIAVAIAHDDAHATLAESPAENATAVMPADNEEGSPASPDTSDP